MRSCYGRRALYEWDCSRPAGSLRPTHIGVYLAKFEEQYLLKKGGILEN